MYDVYCISAGQLTVKKDDNVINKKNNYLNYGLLSLASIIKKSGLSPIQLHGHFSSPRGKRSQGGNSRGESQQSKIRCSLLKEPRYGFNQQRKTGFFLNGHGLFHA